MTRGEQRLCSVGTTDQKSAFKEPPNLSDANSALNKLPPMKLTNKYSNTSQNLPCAYNDYGRTEKITYH
jgi:hypothetical protein